MTARPARPDPFFTFAPMREQQDAVDRIDFRFRWGFFRFRVLHCHLTMFTAGTVIRFHKHSEFEFHFIPRGRGTVHIEDRAFAVREGALFLTGPDVLHQQEADAGEPMYELCLHVDIQEDADAVADDWEAAEAEACVRTLREYPLVVLQDAHRAMPWFLEAHTAIVEHRPGRYTALKQAVIEILLRTARATGRAEEPVELPAGDVKGYRYRAATRFIRDNHGAPISLQDVADAVRISPRQLQRVFHDAGAGSFTAYLEEHRLRRVCESLETTEASIARIAAEHGFGAGGTYLYGVFRRRLGTTPGEYRARRRSERIA